MEQGIEPYLKESLTKEIIIRDLKALGVQEGDLLLVTCAMSEIGWVEGGTKTFLDAVLEIVGEQGGVLSYAFTPLYHLPLKPEDARLVFDRHSDPQAGSFVNLMMHHPNAIRSTHPSCSYLGIGKAIHKILRNHKPSSFAYQPSLELTKVKNGKNLKVGTIQKMPGTVSIHPTQNILKLKNRTLGKYGVNYRDENGKIKLFKRDYVGGCSRGFGNFFTPYREAGAVSEGQVGNAESMLVELKRTIEIDKAILGRDPGFFFCNDPFCHSCRVTWDFSPESPVYFKLKLHLSKLFPALTRFFR